MPASKTTTGTKKASTSTKKTTTGTKKAASGTKKTTTVAKKTTATKATTGVKKTTTTAKKTATTGVKKSTATKTPPTASVKKTVATKAPESKLSERAEQLYLSYKGDEHKFEILCAKCLHEYLEARYPTRRVETQVNKKKTRDGGIDIFSKVVDYGVIEYLYLASVKNKRVVGEEDINSLAGAMTKVDMHIFDSKRDNAIYCTDKVGIIMTSGRLTDDAKKAIRKCKKASNVTIEVLDGDKLSKERFD